MTSGDGPGVCQCLEGSCEERHVGGREEAAVPILLRWGRLRS